MKKTIIIAAIMLLVAGTATLDARTKKSAKTNKASATQVIYTGDIASKVIGYNSTTPVNITVKNGVIENIEVLPNQESPGYLKRAQDKVLSQYIGKTVAEAKKLKPDIATGAIRAPWVEIKYSSTLMPSLKLERMGFSMVSGSAPAF